MKNLKNFTVFLFFSLSIISCSSDNNADDNNSKHGIIATWSLEKTISGETEETEYCTTSFQIKFNDDRNEEDLGSYSSFEDFDCDGTFDHTYDGSYFYKNDASTLTINTSSGYEDYTIETLTKDELVIYNASEEYLYFKKLPDEDDGGGNEGLKADFSILPLCCPPATVSGRYFDEVFIEFKNLSRGNIVAYEWSFGSTEENPSKTFPLTNNNYLNKRVFELTVTDDKGNTDSLEKSIELPILTATATIIFDGQTGIIDYSAFDFPVDPSRYIIEPPFYISRKNLNTGGDAFTSYEIKILPFNEFDNYNIPIPVIRLGGAFPGQQYTMTQSDDLYPTGSNFYVAFDDGGTYYSTFDGPLSSGGVDVQGIENGANIITSISLEGVVSDHNGNQKPFSIALSYVPHVCYYSAFQCAGQPAH